MGGMSWSQIVTLIISILSFLGFGTVTKWFWEDKRAKRKENSDEVKKLKRIEKQDEIREVINAELTPVLNSVDQKVTNMEKDLNEVKNQLSTNTEGTVTLLRDRMKCSLNEAKSRHWASTSDKANWQELYKTYKGLGGNHFREYVDQWKYEMESFPTEDEYKEKHKQEKHKQQ